MVILPCHCTSSNKASTEASDSLTSSRHLSKQDDSDNESTSNNVWNIVSTVQEHREKHQAESSKHASHRRFSSSSRNEKNNTPGKSLCADSTIPLFVYIHRELSLHNSSSSDEEEFLTGEDLETPFSHEFHQWQAFPNASNIKRNAVWGIITATLNDTMDEKIMQTAVWSSSDEKVPLRQSESPESNLFPANDLFSRPTAPTPCRI